MRHYPFFVSVKSLFFSCVCILLFLTNASAQIKIGLNGNKIKSSSLLELESLSQGLLLPRLPDTLEINALIPPDGMLVYIIKNPNSGLYIRKGGAWVPVQLSSSIKAAKSIKGDGALNVNNSGDTIILSANSNTSLWNANKLQGYPISSNVPVAGQLLEWNGSAWIPTAPFRDLNKMTGFINSSQLAAGSVTTEKIPDGAITAAKIGTDYAKERVLVTDVSGNAIWVDRSSFSTNTLNAGNIFIGNVNGVATSLPLTGDIGLTTAGVSSIGLSRVTTGMILDGTVGSNDLASGSVLTDKLQQKSVSLAKLADMATSSFIGRNTAGSGTPEVLSVTSAKTMLALNKNDVGLANVENTSDANKIISTATQTALNLKAPLNSPTFTGTVTAPTFIGALTGNATSATSAGTVTTNANLTGPVTSLGNATAIANGAITNAMLANAAVANLTGTNTGNQTATTVANVASGTIAATTVQAALNELDTEKAALASPTFTGTVTATTFVGALTGNATTATSAGTVTTNANLTGPVTSLGNATAIANGAISNGMLANAAVANLTGTNTGDQTATTVANVASGTIAATTVQAALNELDTEKAALASPTFTGTVTATTFVGALTGNSTTATNAGTVTTNANLTGPVTSLGNATAIANGAITNAMLANAAVANLTGTNTGNQTATTVANVASGTIAATTVQAALNELDTEKASLSGATFTGAVSATSYGRVTGTGARFTFYETTGAPYSITLNDYYIKVNTAVTVTLPSSVGISGQRFIIYNNTGGDYTLIATTSGQTISGPGFFGGLTSRASLKVFSDGANWLME